MGARHPQTTALATARQEERPQLLRSPCPSWTPNTLGPPSLTQLPPRPLTKGKRVEPHSQAITAHGTQEDMVWGPGPASQAPGSRLSVPQQPSRLLLFQNHLDKHRRTQPRPLPPPPLLDVSAAYVS